MAVQRAARRRAAQPVRALVVWRHMPPRPVRPRWRRAVAKQGGTPTTAGTARVADEPPDLAQLMTGGPSGGQSRLAPVATQAVLRNA